MLLEAMAHGGKPRRVLSGKLPTQKPPSQDRLASLLARGLSDSVFDLPPWFIKKNILTNDLRLLYIYNFKKNL